MESLHRNKGGAKSKRAEPSEKEGMGLAVGAAMLWCKLRDSSSGAFFPKISEEVKRCMEGDRDFSKEDMVHFVQNKIFGGDKCYGDKPVREIFKAILGAQADDPVLEATSDAEDEEGEVPAALALQPLPCVARSCVCA